MRSIFPYAIAALAASAFWPQVAAAEDAQYGEAILPANQAPVDAPLRRHPKALWFELSNLRNDTKLSTVGEIALDFRRIVGDVGWHDVFMIVKSNTGRREFRSIGPSPFAQKQGTVRGRTWFGALRGQGDEHIEVWLEQQMNLGGRPVRMKISKSIALGNVGQMTLARQWTQVEQTAFENWEKSTTPPPAPPAGYQLAAADSKLLPGMPVLAGWMAAWQPAEVIDVRKDNTILVKYRDATPLLIARPRNWVAVDGKVLESGRANPSQFHASVKVLPGGTTAVPDDLRPIEPDTPLVKGVPLKADFAGTWSDVTATEIHKDGKVRIHWDALPTRAEDDRERTTLLIAQATLDALKKPGAADEFAKRTEKLAPGTFDAGNSARRNLHEYPIRIPIPKSAVRVTDETPLEEGTRLGCSWGQNWYNVTVLQVHDDGTVKIHWDKFGDAWDADISRECLAIDKKVLAKLEPKANKSAPSKSTSTEDSVAGTDQFKVILKDFGTRKVAVTKAVMEATGLDLKDAKEFVESVPVTIKQNLTKVAAEKLRKDLQESGATVAIELQ